MSFADNLLSEECFQSLFTDSQEDLRFASDLHQLFKAMKDLYLEFDNRAKSIHKKYSGPKLFTYPTYGFASSVEELHGSIATIGSIMAEVGTSFSSIITSLSDSIKVRTADRQQLLLETNSILSTIKSSTASLEKSQQDYTSKAKAADESLVTLNKLKNDHKYKVNQLEKAETRESKAAMQTSLAASGYEYQLTLTNQRIYESWMGELPSLLNRFEEFKTQGVRQYSLLIAKTAESLEKVPSKIKKCAKRVRKAAESVVPSEIAIAFAERYKITPQNRPKPYEFVQYVTSTPNFVHHQPQPVYPFEWPRSFSKQSSSRSRGSNQAPLPELQSIQNSPSIPVVSVTPPANIPATTNTNSGTSKKGSRIGNNNNNMGGFHLPPPEDAAPPPPSFASLTESGAFANTNDNENNGHHHKNGSGIRDSGNDIRNSGSGIRNSGNDSPFSVGTINKDDPRSNLCGSNNRMISEVDSNMMTSFETPFIMPGFSESPSNTSANVFEQHLDRKQGGSNIKSSANNTPSSNASQFKPIFAAQLATLPDALKAFGLSPLSQYQYTNTNTNNNTYNNSVPTNNGNSNWNGNDATNPPSYETVMPASYDDAPAFLLSSSPPRALPSSSVSSFPSSSSVSSSYGIADGVSLVSSSSSIPFHVQNTSNINDNIYAHTSSNSNDEGNNDLGTIALTRQNFPPQFANVQQPPLPLPPHHVNYYETPNNAVNSRTSMVPPTINTSHYNNNLDPSPFANMQGRMKTSHLNSSSADSLVRKGTHTPLHENLFVNTALPQRSTSYPAPSECEPAYEYQPPAYEYNTDADTIVLNASNSPFAVRKNCNNTEQTILNDISPATTTDQAVSLRARPRKPKSKTGKKQPSVLSPAKGLNSKAVLEATLLAEKLNNGTICLSPDEINSVVYQLKQTTMTMSDEQKSLIRAQFPGLVP